MIAADTGPLIALARIGRLPILRDLFQTVVAPQEVVSECLAGENRPGATAIRQALRQGWLKKRRLPSSISLLGRPSMGEGENAAITLAHKLDLLLLVDDKAARQVATINGVAVIGTAGVLIEAKRRRLVRKVKPLIEELQQAGYRLSEALVERVLDRCKER